MVKIKLKNSPLCAIVDSADIVLISGYNWFLHTKGYAYAFKQGRAIMMHRLILGIVDEKELVSDHINHNRLDNRRANIRACTRSENQRNVRPAGKSKYLGVTIQDYVRKNGSVKKRIKALIKTPDRLLYLGSFGSEYEAAKAYDAAAKKYHGEFANLNFK